MRQSGFIEKFNEEFPEIGWNPEENKVTFLMATFEFKDEYHLSFPSSVRQAVKIKILSGYDGDTDRVNSMFGEEWTDLDIRPLDNDRAWRYFAKGIRKWLCDVFKLGMAETPEDQGILFHSDVNNQTAKELIDSLQGEMGPTIPGFNKPLGIINSGHWNFDNPDLISILQENSGGHFTARALTEEEVETLKGTTEWEELIDSHRRFKGITKFYTTDWS